MEEEQFYLIKGKIPGSGVKNSDFASLHLTNNCLKDVVVELVYGGSAAVMRCCNKKGQEIDLPSKYSVKKLNPLTTFFVRKNIYHNNAFELFDEFCQEILFGETELLHSEDIDQYFISIFEIKDANSSDHQYEVFKPMSETTSVEIKRVCDFFKTEGEFKKQERKNQIEELKSHKTFILQFPFSAFNQELQTFSKFEEEAKISHLLKLEYGIEFEIKEKFKECGFVEVSLKNPQDLEENSTKILPLPQRIFKKIIKKKRIVFYFCTNQQLQPNYELSRLKVLITYFKLDDPALRKQYRICVNSVGPQSHNFNNAEVSNERISIETSSRDVFQALEKVISDRVCMYLGQLSFFSKYPPHSFERYCADPYCSKLRNSEHIRQFIHYCLPLCPCSPFHCTFQKVMQNKNSDHEYSKEIDEHMKIYSHVCPLGMQCPDKQDAEHLRQFVHLKKENLKIDDPKAMKLLENPRKDFKLLKYSVEKGNFNDFRFLCFQDGCNDKKPKHERYYSHIYQISKNPDYFMPNQIETGGLNKNIDLSQNLKNMLENLGRYFKMEICDLLKLENVQECAKYVAEFRLTHRCKFETFTSMLSSNSFMSLELKKIWKDELEKLEDSMCQRILSGKIDETTKRTAQDFFQFLLFRETDNEKNEDMKQTFKKALQSHQKLATEVEDFVENWKKSAQTTQSSKSLECSKDKLILTDKTLFAIFGMSTYELYGDIMIEFKPQIMFSPDFYFTPIAGLSVLSGKQSEKSNMNVRPWSQFLNISTNLDAIHSEIPKFPKNIDPNIVALFHNSKISPASLTQLTNLIQKGGTSNIDLCMMCLTLDLMARIQEKTGKLLTNQKISDIDSWYSAEDAHSTIEGHVPSCTLDFIERIYMKASHKTKIDTAFGNNSIWKELQDKVTPISSEDAYYKASIKFRNARVASKKQAPQNLLSKFTGYNFSVGYSYSEYPTSGVIPLTSLTIMKDFATEIKFWAKGSSFFLQLGLIPHNNNLNFRDRENLQTNPNLLVFVGGNNKKHETNTESLAYLASNACCVHHHQIIENIDRNSSISDKSSASAVEIGPEIFNFSEEEPFPSQNSRIITYIKNFSTGLPTSEIFVRYILSLKLVLTGTFGGERKILATLKRGSGFQILNSNEMNILLPFPDNWKIQNDFMCSLRFAKETRDGSRLDIRNLKFNTVPVVK